MYKIRTPKQYETSPATQYNILTAKSTYMTVTLEDAGVKVTV
jgi:hypothetical protein